MAQSCLCARRLYPPASYRSPRRASVRAHPTPVLRHNMAGHKLAEGPLVPIRDDIYLLVRSEGRLAEGARSWDERGGIGISRAFLGEHRADPNLIWVVPRGYLVLPPVRVSPYQLFDMIGGCRGTRTLDPLIKSRCLHISRSFSPPLGNALTL